MSGCQAIPKHNTGDETTFNAFPILDGDITPVDKCLLLRISLTL